MITCPTHRQHVDDCPSCIVAAAVNRMPGRICELEGQLAEAKQTIVRERYRALTMTVALETIEIMAGPVKPGKAPPMATAAIHRCAVDALAAPAPSTGDKETT